jgi:glycosyltransferase involved in cell wall biosynthesis
VDDGINGFVVKPQEDVLAEKIVDLLLDKEKRQIFGKNAKETAQSKWSYKNQAVILMNIYKEFLNPIR